MPKVRDCEPTQPDLVIQRDDLPATARDLCGRLSASGEIFVRAGRLVRLVLASGAADLKAVEFSAHAIVVRAHEICRPVEMRVVNDEIIPVPATLPHRVAQLVLATPEMWAAPELRGISSAPLLNADGSIYASRGYDVATRQWCTGLDLPPIPERPTQEDAHASLLTLRDAFSTFAFADREIVAGSNFAPLTDLSRPPAMDETLFLVALLTAVCRPSLPSAPAILIRAPTLSGMGTGKGLLVRAICAIAFGAAPHAFSGG